ncbi:MAG TPA: hypothetical protein PKL83_06205, partial [bacterium]|nr:hypothetical protein [bacterium]
MAEHDTRQGSIPETIDRIGLLLAVCLFMAALVDSLTNWGRISLVLAAVCIAASTVLYKQFVTTGPYDPKLLFPLRFWLASLAIVLAIASTGGTGSIYIIALLYPTLLAAIQPQTQRRAVKCLLILYAALLVISLVMPGGTVMLRRWPVIPVQLAGFMFIAYW